MNYAVFICNLKKPVAVGALQLCRLTVFENAVDYRVIGTELFKYLRTRAVAGLRLFEHGELKLVKKHLAELLWGVYVELTSRLEINALRVLLTAYRKLVRIRRKSFAVYLEADALHIGKHARKRLLNIVVERGLTAFLELFVERVGKLVKHLRTIVAFVKRRAEILDCKAFKLIVTFRRIYDVARKGDVEELAGNSAVVKAETLAVADYYGTVIVVEEILNIILFGYRKLIGAFAVVYLYIVVFK